MKRTWLGLSVVVGLVFVLAVPGCTDFQTGVDAYNRGDYATALKEFRPLAEQGDAAAQFDLGTMYDKGQGVPQGYQQAAGWYTKAAEAGYASAQNNLASMYFIGEGVPQDYVLAHMWAHLAASQGGEDAVNKRDAIATFMTPAQLAQAQRLAREWKAKGK